MSYFGPLSGSGDHRAEGKSLKYVIDWVKIIHFWRTNHWCELVFDISHTVTISFSMPKRGHPNRTKSPLESGFLGGVSIFHWSQILGAVGSSKTMPTPWFEWILWRFCLNLWRTLDCHGRQLLGELIHYPNEEELKQKVEEMEEKVRV